MLKFKNVFVGILLTTFSYISLATELNIEHVANAGVRISSGDQTVLIDALFGPHKRFNSLSDEDFTPLIRQGADIALATHAHSDHFSSKRTLAFLKQNPETLFIGTPQVLELLDKNNVSSQLASESLIEFQSKQFTHHNINVTALNFPHGDPEYHGKTQNYGYLVEINGWKILHVGDAGINSERIEGLKLSERNIDLALIHDRCLRQNDCVELIGQMNVGKVAFIHMTDDKTEPLVKWLKVNFPNATVLVTGYERMQLNK